MITQTKHKKPKKPKPGVITFTISSLETEHLIFSQTHSPRGAQLQ